MQETSEYKILTIDDEPYIRQSIRAYFEDYGFTVFEAENGRIGIEVFEDKRPDLVLLDLRMPEMDGLQVLETLKKRAPDIPLVVASGTGNITAVVEALRLGAWDYVLKPVEDMSVLFHSVDKCLKESRLKRENKLYQERLEELVKERTAALKESEERYRAVFEYTGTAALIVESDDTIFMANSKFAQLAGMTAREIVGKKRWVDFVAPEDVLLLKNDAGKVADLCKSMDVSVQKEIRFIGTDGIPKYVYVSLGVIPGTDRSVISLLDVTEKKKAEKRWQSLEKQLRKSHKMEAIGTLAGGIAHDLNNILSPVLGYADMIMLSSDLHSDTYKRSEKIRTAALRAAELVNQVLFFNRQGEAGKRQIRLHPVLKEVVKLLKGSIPSTITIVDNIDRDCNSVEADPTQIHQVVMNLCTNAFHAMEENGGTLTVGLFPLSEESARSLEFLPPVAGKGPYVCLEVSDTGCGMDENIQDRIFDPYFTTKEEGKGTGLGLAMVYSIIKSCKGEIRVSSQMGVGTRFRVLLPVIEDDMGQEKKEPVPENVDGGHGERLLVVDDDRDIATMLQEGFRAMGYHVDLFFSGLEALDFFIKNYKDIDAVVTDQTMPGKTGLDLAKDIMAIRPDIPVIVCSGYAGTINENKIQEAGVTRLVMKPVTVKVLSREIQMLLRQKLKFVKDNHGR